MKYKIELSYVCYQAPKPWWSKIEIKGFETRMTKKNQLKMDLIKKGEQNLITNKINKEKKALEKKLLALLLLLLPHLPPNQGHPWINNIDSYWAIM